MPTYSFQMSARVAGSSVSVTAAGSTDVVASGTLDANALFTASLPVGDYVATAAGGHYSYKSAGTVAQGDSDQLADLSSFARKSTAREVVGYDALLATLNEGVDDVGVGLIGDSTGDAVDEWFQMLGSYLAYRFPSYTVIHRGWSDATQQFAAPTTVQTGTAGRRAVLTPATTPAAPAYPGPNVSGDLDIRVNLKPATWRSGNQTIASKFGNGGANVDRSFRFQTNSSGNLLFDWSTDGAALQTVANSGAAVPFADGAEGWVRVTLDVDNGAGGHAVAFYTSTDGQTWTQLGSTTTRATGATSIYPGAWPWEIGARTSQAEPMPNARFYEVQIRDGIDGPTIAPRLASLWEQPSGGGATTIEGAPVLTMVNGSHPGAPISYLNEATRVKRLTPDFGQAVQFFSDSHNEQRVTGLNWINKYGPWVTNVLGRLPLAAPVLLTQNPRYTPATWNQAHAIRRRQIIGWARQKGYGVIDTYQAFLDDGRGSVLINSDGIHPTQAANGGQTVWLNAIKAPLL